MGLADSTCFADRAVYRTVTVRENVKLARDTYRVRFDCPEIAERIVPGQFVMMRLAGSNDPLLGRPLALYDTVVGNDQEPIGLDIVYLVVGKFTARLAQARPGQRLEVWGPLGNGFMPRQAEHLVMVAGGIGQTPFLALRASSRAAARMANQLARPKPSTASRSATACAARITWPESRTSKPSAYVS